MYRILKNISLDMLLMYYREEEEERYMSAEDSEILSITNSAIGSFTKSDSFRSLAGDDYRFSYLIFFSFVQVGVSHLPNIFKTNDTI